MDVCVVGSRQTTQAITESDVDFVARLPQSVKNTYSCLVGRKDVLSVLKPMYTNHKV